MLDAETPVNPYSLLEAVNRSSDSANAAWLIYIGLMSYLLITVAGVSHKDLLLNADIALPILQVKIELTRFFLFAPILLVLMHVGADRPAGAAGAQDAGVRGLHPHARDQRPAHPPPAPRARQLLLRAGHRRPRAQPHRRHVPARHVVADDRGHAGGRCCSTCSSCSCPITTSPSPGCIGSPCSPTSRCWCSSACSCGGSETSFFRAFLRTSLHHPLSLLLTAALLAGDRRLLALRRHHSRRGHRPALGRRRRSPGRRWPPGVRLRRARLRGRCRKARCSASSSATSTSPTPTSWSTRR